MENMQSIYFDAATGKLGKITETLRTVQELSQNIASGTLDKSAHALNALVQDVVSSLFGLSDDIFDMLILSCGQESTEELGTFGNAIRALAEMEAAK